jgi:hypothetical protein
MAVGTIGTRILISTLIVVTAAGCGAPEKHDHPGPVTSMITASAAPRTSTAVTPTPVSPPVGVPLYEEFEAEHSVGPNGKPVEANLAGTHYPSSTGMWVGCSGDAATTTYRLDRKFGRLTAVAGLQPHTPDGLRVDVTISGDGRPLQQFVVEKRNTVPVDVDVSGTDALVVAAIAINRSLCGASGTPYGALGAATLTEAAR